jgi:NADPH-dependent curcumin reductase CurA
MLGIYSAESPLSHKQVLWDKIAETWSVDLEGLSQEINLEEVPVILEKMLSGNSSGRFLVKI